MKSLAKVFILVFIAVMTSPQEGNPPILQSASSGEQQNVQQVQDTPPERSPTPTQDEKSSASQDSLTCGVGVRRKPVLLHLLKTCCFWRTQKTLQIKLCSISYSHKFNCIFSSPLAASSTSSTVHPAVAIWEQRPRQRCARFAPSKSRQQTYWLRRDYVSWLHGITTWPIETFTHG